jgi:hypothetical protein
MDASILAEEVAQLRSRMDDLAERLEAIERLLNVRVVADNRIQFGEGVAIDQRK